MANPDVMDLLARHVGEMDKYYRKTINHYNEGRANKIDQFIMHPPQDYMDKVDKHKEKITNMFDQLENDLDLCEQYLEIQIKHKIEDEKRKFKYTQ